MNEVEFFGRITAGFTHEFKNVLATVRESAGLMEDILAMTQGASSPHQARLARSISIIMAQVNRGNELLSGLNRFAHGPDHPGKARLDLNEIVEQMVVLSQRFARLKGVTLSVRRADAAVPVELPQVPLQMVVFTCLELCWTRTPSGGEVSTCAAGEEKGAVVDFLCRGKDGADASCFEEAAGGEAWMNLSAMAEHLGGAVEIGLGFPGMSLRFARAC